MSRARDALVVFAFALSLLAVALTPWWTRDRVASASQWVDAVRDARAHLPAGSVLLIHPPWRDDVEQAIRASGALPPGVTVTTALAPRHGEALPALVILREDDGVALPVVLRERDAIARSHGLVFERVQKRSGQTRARDLIDELARAHVEVRRADDTVACTWDAAEQRHTCEPLPEWVHVGVEMLPVQGKRERCAWAHPITDGTLVVDVPGAGIEGTWTLDLALTDTAADNHGGAAVTARVFAGATELARVTRKAQRGFGSASFDVPAASDTVRVEVTTPDDGQRHTCFRLRQGAR